MELKKVAWWWMWLLASGWCFALQAGSIANDSFAAIYILAAVDLALRARETKSVSDLWLSLLAAALAQMCVVKEKPLGKRDLDVLLSPSCADRLSPWHASVRAMLTVRRVRHRTVGGQLVLV